MDLFKALLGAGVWGIILAIAALYSKGIAMPTGIHYAINLTTAAFGAADSSTSIWILSSSGTPGNSNSALALFYIPAACLLLIGIVLMELFVRRKLIPCIPVDTDQSSLD